MTQQIFSEENKVLFFSALTVFRHRLQYLFLPQNTASHLSFGTKTKDGALNFSENKWRRSGEMQELKPLFLRQPAVRTKSVIYLGHRCILPGEFVINRSNKIKHNSVLNRRQATHISASIFGFHTTLAFRYFVFRLKMKGTRILLIIQVR